MRLFISHVEQYLLKQSRKYISVFKLRLFFLTKYLYTDYINNCFDTSYADDTNQMSLR